MRLSAASGGLQRALDPVEIFPRSSGPDANFARPLRLLLKRADLLH